MTKCRKPEAVPACFTPADGSDPVSILYTALYDADSKPLGGHYQDETGAIIEPSTFMGGGTASIGACVATITEPQCWEVPARVLEGNSDAPFEIADDLIIVSQGGQGNALGPFVNTQGGLEFSVDGTTFGTWGNTVGGNGNQFVIDQDPLFIRNPVTRTTVPFDITVLTGGGSPTYAAIVNIPAERFTVIDGQAFDKLGNETVLPDGAVQVECTTLDTILEELRNKKTGGVETCFTLPNNLGQATSGSFFEDVAGANISENFTFEFSEDGTITGLILRLNALATFGGVQTMVSLLSDGGVGTNTVNTFGGVFPHTFTFDTPITGAEGDVVTFEVIVEAGIESEVQYNGTSTQQFVNFETTTGAFPMVTILAEGGEAFRKVTYSDKTCQFFDSQGQCIDALPSGVDECASQELSKLCDIDDKLQSLIDLQAPEGTENIDDFCYEVQGADEPITGLSGTLSDGTTYTVVTDGITASEFNRGELYANGSADPSPSTFRIIFSAPTTVTVTPAQVAGFGAMPSPTVWHDVAGFPASAMRNVGGTLTYTAGATALPITDSGNENEVTVAGSGTNGVSWNAPWGSVVGEDSTEFEIVIVAHDRFVVNFSRPNSSGKAYKQLNEDGSLVGYFDRITDEPISAASIIECPEDSNEVSIAAECKQELAHLINAPADLTKTVSRTSGPNTYSANYCSLSITAFSGDVTIDGQDIPQGFGWSVSSNENERFVNDTIVDGTDYIVTLVQ